MSKRRGDRAHIEELLSSLGCPLNSQRHASESTINGMDRTADDVFHIARLLEEETYVNNDWVEFERRGQNGVVVRRQIQHEASSGPVMESPNCIPVQRQFHQGAYGGPPRQTPKRIPLPRHFPQGEYSGPLSVPVGRKFENGAPSATPYAPQWKRPRLPLYAGGARVPEATSTVPPLRGRAHPLAESGIAIRSDAIFLSNAEICYFETIDSSIPLLQNLLKTCERNEVDLGKLGIVLLKYEKTKRLDSGTYKVCVAAFAQFSLEIAFNVSVLGELAPKVFQLAHVFLHNVNVKRSENAQLKEPKTMKLKPTFQFCTKTFAGSFPFVQHAEVSLLNRGAVPADVQRAVTFVIRNTLAQIFADKDSHQCYAVRMHDKNGKRGHQDLPEEVKDFVNDFVLCSFGYPPSIRFVGYTLENLGSDNPDLLAKLGETTEEREKIIPVLQQDVHTFTAIIQEKLQRTLNDLRKYEIRTSQRTVDGRVYTMKTFVRPGTAISIEENTTEEPRASPQAAPSAQ
ncbi:unnamed protein product [Caenorhabditis sp. 36 PRJEB53466]|nr:unnamed protein product [Caenorhabditis sp. 36 PRJEB53466]